MEGKIIVDLKTDGSIKSIHGCCKAKDFKAQIKELNNLRVGDKNE